MAAYLTAALAWLRRFYELSKGKATTYVAFLTAGLSELIGSWDQSAALFPQWLVAQKPHIVAASGLLAIWTRIRREL